MPNSQMITICIDAQDNLSHSDDLVQWEVKDPNQRIGALYGESSKGPFDSGANFQSIGSRIPHQPFRVRHIKW